MTARRATMKRTPAGAPRLGRSDSREPRSPRCSYGFRRSARPVRCCYHCGPTGSRLPRRKLTVLTTWLSAGFGARQNRVIEDRLGSVERPAPAAPEPKATEPSHDQLHVDRRRRRPLYVYKREARRGRPRQKHALCVPRSQRRDRAGHILVTFPAATATARRMDKQRPAGRSCGHALVGGARAQRWVGCGRVNRCVQIALRRERLKSSSAEWVRSGGFVHPPAPPTVRALVCLPRR